MLTPLREADPRCGAKAATLARLLREGFPVPPGLVIGDALGAEDWVRELEPALRALGGGPFAVRSSAVGEDGADVSFAGQLHTGLDVTTTAQVIEQVRRVAASGSGSAAGAYTARLGRPLGPTVPVLVQILVRAEVAGVLFTHHPVTGADQVVIEAGRGLGDAVVEGRVSPQSWTVTGRAVSGPSGAGDPCLSTAQALALAGTGRRVEALLGCPQDVEWALAAGTIHVLQARPITTDASRTTSAAAVPAARGAGTHGTVLATGTPASPGTASGPVRIVRGLDDFASFAAGDVLVCRTTSPAWTPLLARAAAVVTETGGVLAHAAIVAREFGIPAVLAADAATSVLTDGRPVLVDGASGTVTAADRSGSHR